MLDAPRQDWDYYEARSRDANAEWLRSLTLDDRLALYEDMFTMFWEARDTTAGDAARLGQWRWQEKLAMRRRLVEAFTLLDDLRRERTAANNVG